MSDEGKVTTVNDRRHYIRIGKKVVKDDGQKPEIKNKPVFDGNTAVSSPVGDSLEVKNKNGETKDAELETAKKDFIKYLEDSLEKEEITPDTLKDALKKDVIKDTTLRKEVEGYIAEIASADRNKLLEMNKDKNLDPVKKHIVNIYITQQIRMEITVLSTRIQEYPNFTEQLAALKEGKYIDSTGEKRDLGYKYPKDDFQKWALASYEKGVQPYAMLQKLKGIMTALREDDTREILTKRKDIRAAIIAKATELYGEDEAFNKFVNKSNKNKLIDVLKHYDAIMQRREELKHIKAEDLVADKGDLKLDEKTLRSLQTYLEAKDQDGKYLHQYEEDGVTYYDLSELSDIILKATGFDFFVNRDKRQSEDEVYNAKVLLGEKLDNNVFESEGGTSETEDLIKFCGYEIDSKRDRSGWWKDLGLGLLSGLASGAVYSAVAGRSIKIGVNDVDVTNVSISGIGSINLTDIITGTITVGTNADPASAVLIGGAALVGAGIRIAAGKKREENECSNYIGLFNAAENECKTIKGFAQRLHRAYPATSAAEFEKILAPYRLDAVTNEGFDWDYSKWMSDYEYQKGQRSKMNDIECQNMLSIGNQVEEPAEPIKFQYTEYTTETPDEVHDEKGDAMFSGNEIKGDGWECFALEAYGNNQELRNSYVGKFGHTGYENAIRLVKLAQCIKDENYTKERMDYLLELSWNQPSKLRELDYFNADIYFDKVNPATRTTIKGIRNANDLPSMMVEDEHGNLKKVYVVKLPAELAGVKRTRQHGEGQGCNTKIEPATKLDQSPAPTFGSYTIKGTSNYKGEVIFGDQVIKVASQEELQNTIKQIQEENEGIGDPEKKDWDEVHSAK